MVRVVSASDGQMCQADVLKSERSITFFLAHLPPVVAEVNHLQILYDIASQAFCSYMRNAGRDPQELKIRMRHAKERSIPLRKAQDLVNAINDKIDHHIKRLTLAPCQAVCKQVIEKLPPEIRDEIYHYLVSGLIEHQLPLGQVFTYHLPRVIDVPQVSYWLKDATVPPFEIMRTWLGETFALEFIAEWYRGQKGLPIQLSRHWDALTWLTDDIWGSPLKPQSLIKFVKFTIGGQQITRKKDSLLKAISPVLDKLATLEPHVAQFRRDAKVSFIIQLKEMTRSGPKSQVKDVSHLSEMEQVKFVRVFVEQLQVTWKKVVDCRVVTLHFQRKDATLIISSDGTRHSLANNCVEKLGEARPEDEEEVIAKNTGEDEEDEEEDEEEEEEEEEDEYEYDTDEDEEDDANETDEEDDVGNDVDSLSGPNDGGNANKDWSGIQDISDDEEDGGDIHVTGYF